MTYVWRYLLNYLSAGFLCLLLCACSGDSPWRYNPGAPDQPAGLSATADNGQVFLSWTAVNNAAAYTIYYATSPGVSRTNGTKIANVVSTSYILTGLTNGTTYYFVITAVNSSSESIESSQVSATPALLGSYVPGDLEGSWNFSVLVSGVGAGWMRGNLAVNNSGSVTFNSYLDSAGTTIPPATLFPALFLSSSGHVRDSLANTPAFQGFMAANRKMIVGGSSPTATSHILAILQKQTPGVIFSNAGDLQGFGNTGGGGRRFIYNQIASGSSQEWECASGQIGRDQKTQYTTFNAPSNPVKPGDKASILNISPDGIVTESLTGALPQPSVVLDKGFMSADKSMIIGTTTDTSGAAPKYVLRIYQLVNVQFNDLNTFALPDLAGTYELRTLAGGVSPLSASGIISISQTGSAVYSAYFDSTGSGILPADFSLSIDANGSLTNTADPSLQGKLSYFKDLFVFTKTDSPGMYSLTIALKQ